MFKEDGNPNYDVLVELKWPDRDFDGTPLNKEI